MQVNWRSMHGTWWLDRRISCLDTEGGAWDKPRIEYVGVEIFEFSCPFKSVNRKQEGKYSQYRQIQLECLLVQSPAPHNLAPGRTACRSERWP